jgi:hypothetical protein
VQFENQWQYEREEGQMNQSGIFISNAANRKEFIRALGKRCQIDICKSN